MRLNKKLETQLNLYKEFNENQILLHELNKALKQRNQYKTERDTLIDDLTWYKAKVERLERENKQLEENNEQLNEIFNYQENKKKEYREIIEKLERELSGALNGELSTYDELQKYVLELQSDVTEHQKENEKLNKVADEAIDLAESENSKVLKLDHENKRLTRLTHKLITHRTMWDKLKDWRRDMLEIDKNDTQLISLGLVMDELEKRHLYKERE